MEAVVVLSGGQDSALCLALAVRKYGADAVAAITFEYGQRHAVETKYARRLAKHFGISRHKLVKFGFYGDLTDSALFAGGGAEAIGRETRRRRGAPPATVVEGRNAFFLLAAAVWAKSLGAHDIWTGVSQTDYSGYPDCRAPFIAAQRKAASLALDYPLKITAPFMRKTKAEEWALADRLGILELVRDKTVTCYNGIPGAGCGKCPACRLRNRGLARYLAEKKSAGRRQAASPAYAGTVKTSRQPSPGAESTVIEPPSAAMRRRMVARP